MARTAKSRPLSEHVSFLTRQRNQIEVNSGIPLQTREKILDLLAECLKLIRRQMTEASSKKTKQTSFRY